MTSFIHFKNMNLQCVIYFRPRNWRVPHFANQQSKYSDPGIGECHAMPTNNLNVCKHNCNSVSYISDPGIGKFHAMLTNNLIVCKHNCYSVSYISDLGIGEFHILPTNILNIQTQELESSMLCQPII